MKRREFLHITALGSAAGVMSFTGLGLLWDDAPPDGGALPTDDGGPSPTANPGRTTTATATPASTEGADDGTDVPLETPTATATPTPTATDAEVTGTERATSPDGGTATPRPSRNVHAEFTPLDDTQEVYVQLENANAFAVDVIVTITWGYDDGTTATEVVMVSMEADSFWADSIYHDAGNRTVQRWGHELDVEKR